MRAMMIAALVFVAASEGKAQNVRLAPDGAPATAVIAPADEAGTRLTVRGRVLGANDRPLAAASIHVYQTDANGEYVPGASGGGSDRPRLFALLRSDAEGHYSLSTIRPGSYPGTRNPGHIHFEVAAENHDSRVYEIVFEGDPLIPDAFRAQARQPFGGVEIVTARSVANGTLEVDHDIRLRAR